MPGSTVFAIRFPIDRVRIDPLDAGKFGEMSTLMNYTFQSFNFRGRTKLRPYRTTAICR